MGSSSLVLLQRITREVSLSPDAAPSISFINIIIIVSASPPSAGLKMLVDLKLRCISQKLYFHIWHCTASKSHCDNTESHPQIIPKVGDSWRWMQKYFSVNAEACKPEQRTRVETSGHLLDWAKISTTKCVSNAESVIMTSHRGSEL